MLGEEFDRAAALGIRGDGKPNLAVSTTAEKGYNPKFRFVLEVNVLTVRLFVKFGNRQADMKKIAKVIGRFVDLQDASGNLFYPFFRLSCRYRTIVLFGTHTSG